MHIHKFISQNQFQHNSTHLVNNLYTFYIFIFMFLQLFTYIYTYYEYAMYLLDLILFNSFVWLTRSCLVPCKVSQTTEMRLSIFYLTCVLLFSSPRTASVAWQRQRPRLRQWPQLVGGLSFVCCCCRCGCCCCCCCRCSFCFCNFYFVCCICHH